VVAVGKAYLVEWRSRVELKPFFLILIDLPVCFLGFPEPATAWSSESSLLIGWSVSPNLVEVFLNPL